MKTVIVVPIHNAIEYTSRTLKALVGTTPPWTPIVLVDDASNAETGAFLEHWGQETNAMGRFVTLLRNGRQQLFTRTVNRGIRYAYKKYSPESIAIVNSDCDLRAGWLSQLQMGMDRDPKVGLVGYPDSFDASQGPGFITVSMPGYITGHCFLVRTKLFEEIGVLCETDTDGRESPELAGLKGQAHIGSERVFCWKANAAGWKTLYANFPNLCGHEAGKSWGHDLNWLAGFDLQPLWPACDVLENPGWVD